MSPEVVQATTTFHLSAEASTERHVLLGYTCNNLPTKLNLFIKESYISYKLTAACKYKL